MRAHTVIEDSVVVKADATRFYGVVIVYAVGVTPPLGVEIRAARALLRSD